jgi:hypothetical protein
MIIDTLMLMSDERAAFSAQRIYMITITTKSMLRQRSKPCCASTASTVKFWYLLSNGVGLAVVAVSTLCDNASAKT